MVDQQRINRLSEIIRQLGSVVVAFSGGTDSTLLLAACLRELGPDRVLAATADSPTLPRSELREAEELAAQLGARHVVIATNELGDERFACNPENRCYYCKQELFSRLRSLAEESGFAHLVYGATAADLGDHRPGMVAAQEAGAMAPLLQAGLTKQDVRDLSRQFGLPTWDKPAMACLSSRFPYGLAITEPALRQVEAAEELLRSRLGFRQVRVRHHGDVARIEVPVDDLPRLVQTVRAEVVGELLKLGYTYVTVDLEGFRSGSMNEALRPFAQEAKR